MGEPGHVVDSDPSMPVAPTDMGVDQYYVSRQRAPSSKKGAQ